MESNISQTRLNLERIARAPIPVSEESPIYKYFFERKYMCERLSKEFHHYDEIQIEVILEEFEKINEEIRKYFYL